MRFYADKHLYLNDKDETYKSVTSLIKDFCPKKDWDKIATAYAKKHKRTVADVKGEWEKEKQLSIIKGVDFHNFMEKTIIEKNKIKIDGEWYSIFDSPIVNNVKKAKILKLEDGVYPELIVYSHKYKLAGQADLITVRKGAIHIEDYKTNKKIVTESYKHWKDGHEMMLYPLSKFMDCNFWHYTIQLNIYMFLLRTHNPNLKVGTMVIKHNTPDGIVEYKVTNIQSDIKRLLEYYKERSKFKMI